MVSKEQKQIDRIKSVLKGHDKEITELQIKISKLPSIVEIKRMNKLEEYICPKCGMKFLCLLPNKHEFACSRCHRRWTIIEGINKINKIKK